MELSDLPTQPPMSTSVSLITCKLCTVPVYGQTHVFWQMQGGQAHLDALGTGNAVDASTGAERTAKTRITRSDGSTVIGHMEVGVMLRNHPLPPPHQPWGLLTRCCTYNLLCTRLESSCCSWLAICTSAAVGGMHAEGLEAQLVHGA